MSARRHLANWRRFFRVDRPLRLFRWGRKADPNFSADERLYLFVEDRGFSDGPLTAAQRAYALTHEQLRLPNQSFNRSKYSRPHDVLYPDRFSYGVVEVPVDSAGAELQSAGGLSFRFRPTHVPETDNFAHGEIWVWKQGTQLANNGKINPNVKHGFKNQVASAAVLIKDPAPANLPPAAAPV